MIDIKFEINGKRVKPDSIADAMEASILHDVAKDIQKQVGSLVCEEHGESPEITVMGDSIENLTFEVSGCCDAIIERVVDAYE